MTDYDCLKSLVYGIGRGTGIRITPRHHAGTVDERIVKFAAEIVNAERLPPDSVCTSIQAAFDTLVELVDMKADSSRISEAIIAYIDARVLWSNRGVAS